MIKKIEEINKEIEQAIKDQNMIKIKEKLKERWEILKNIIFTEKNKEELKELIEMDKKIKFIMNQEADKIQDFALKQRKMQQASKKYTEL
jgi:hypothetical protein